MSQQILDNKRRAALLLAAPAVFTIALAWSAGAVLGFGVIGLIGGVAVGAALGWLAYRRSTPLALAMSGAVPADPVAHARLHNLTEGLCVAAGLPKPALYVVEEETPTAFAIGRDPKHAAVVVTTALLDRLSRIELEGVLAHELSHIKSYDIRVGTLAVAILGLPLQFFAPLLARGMRLVLDRRREIDADVTGVALTRYPPGLIAALEKLRERSEPAHPAPPATAHLWCTTDPPLEERIQALREL